MRIRNETFKVKWHGANNTILGWGPHVHNSSQTKSNKKVNSRKKNTYSK